MTNLDEVCVWTFRRPVQTLALDMPNFGGNREGLGEKFRTYVVLETSWWVGLYVTCWRFKPTVALMQTQWGAMAVRRAGSWLQRAWPSRYESIVKAADRVYGSKNGRAFGEWLLINKVLAPVSFPAKLALANRIVNQRAAIAAAGAVIVAASPEAVNEPDLTPEHPQLKEVLDAPVETVVSEITRTVTEQAQDLTGFSVTKRSSSE